MAIATKRKASKHAQATGLWNGVSLAFRGGKYERAQEILDKYERKFRSHSMRRRWLCQYSQLCRDRWGRTHQEEIS